MFTYILMYVDIKLLQLVQHFQWNRRDYVDDYGKGLIYSFNFQN